MTNPNDPQNPGIPQFPSYAGSNYDSPQADIVSIEKPQSFVNSVYVCWGMVALSVLGLIYTVVIFDSVKDSIKKALTVDGETITNDNIDSVANISAVTGLVVNLLFLIVFAVFIYFYSQAKNWARIVLTVFFALNVISTIVNLMGTYVDAISFGLNVIRLLLLVGALVLMWMPPTSEYFKTVKASSFIQR